jgi:hypothetical protein
LVTFAFSPLKVLLLIVATSCSISWCLVPSSGDPKIVNYIKNVPISSSCAQRMLLH